MKKMFKKAVAAALTAITALSAVVAMPVSVNADEATTFTEVTYKFECTEFVGEDTITLEAQGSSWTACEKVTYDVKGTGAFEMKAVWPAAEASFKNMGYLSSANSVANIFKLTSVVINDTEFVFQADATAMDGDVCKDAIYQTSTINPTDGAMNGFPNIWNKAGQQAVVAKADSGATINGSTEDITINWEGSEPDTSADSGEDATTEVPAFDPNAKYNAYIGIQTPTYTFRNAWDEAQYGKATEYFNQMTGWKDNEAVAKAATFTDAVIDGNGTYSVKVEGFGDWIAEDFTEQDYFNLLFVSTDIPLESDVKITNVKLIIDGSTKHTDDEGFIDTDPGVVYTKILVQNIWNPDKAEISYYPIPKNSVEIQFTIEGFAYDNANGGVEETEAKVYTTKSQETTADSEKGNGSTIIIVVVVVVIVAVVVVAAVVVAGKKKKSE